MVIAPMAASEARLISSKAAPPSSGSPVATATASGNCHGRSLGLIVTNSRASRRSSAPTERREDFGDGIVMGLPRVAQPVPFPVPLPVPPLHRPRGLALMPASVRQEAVDPAGYTRAVVGRSEEHTSELQSRENLV